MTHDHDDMLWPDEAIERIIDLQDEVLANRATEIVPIEKIGGRTLADEVVASDAEPASDRATMDGFTFDATDEYPLTVCEEEIFPEDEPPTVEHGEAVKIATGAQLPESANTVLKREDAKVDEGMLSGPTIPIGNCVYERGSNVEAGEQLFAPGERLSPRDAILLRDSGLESVTVYERFSVGILATGSEIHEGKQRDLDSPMLAGLIEAWGHEPVYEGTAPDTYNRIESRIRELAERNDVLLTTGGTSVGHKDYVISALDELGTVLFHRVRLRPGKPITVAQLDEYNTVVFAIPGKPIGAHTVTSLVARPFFVGDTGEHPIVSATLERDVGISTDGFEYAVPVTLEDGAAMPLGHADSPLSVYEDTFDPSVLSSSTRASRADGFFLTESAIEAGEMIEVVPYAVVE